MNIIIVSLMFLNSSSLPLLLALSSFWGFIFTVKRFTKLQTGFIPLFVLSSLATLGYFACFFSIFKGFNFFLMLFGNSLLLLEVFFLGKDLIKKKLTLRSYLLAQKTVFFFIFCSVALFFYINNASLYGWDEFFWGQFSKFIHQYGHFWQLGDAVLSSHSVYPPMVAISQNLFMPFGTFNEEAMFFANLLPITFVFTYLFDSLTQNSISKKNFLILVVTFSLIYWTYFYFCFSSVHRIFYWSFAETDHAMAMIFTMTLLFWYESRKWQNAILFLLPPLFFLTLYKTTGVLLAVSSVTIFLLPKLINAFKERKKNLIKSNLLLVLIFSFIICSAYFTWNNYNQIALRTSDESSAGAISFFKQLHLKNNFHSQVINNFRNALTERPLNYGVSINKKLPQFNSLIFWFTFILLIQLVAMIYSRKELKKMELFFFFFLLDVCFIFWILFHLYIWLFVFSEYEGLLLASYERYLNTFLAAILIFDIYLLSKASLKNKKVFMFLIALTIFLNLGFGITKKSIFIGPRFFRESNRDLQTSLAVKVKRAVGGQPAKIWFISQKSNGYEAMIFRYEMSPKYYVQAWGWSLGEKYYPEDVWTTDLSIVEFQNLLLGNSDNPKIPYRFIVLGKVDQQFQDQYGELFSEKTSNDTLWKLQESDGSVKAIPIPL